MKLVLFLMTEKGLAVLRGIIANGRASAIDRVIGSRDATVEYDFYEEIKATCIASEVPFHDRRESGELTAEYALAISWRWLIHGFDNLVVLHDSLLPRYRGFAPVVNALINGDKYIGVTALHASESYDEGDIIEQAVIELSYPVKINQAISALLPLYERLSTSIVATIFAGRPLPRAVQNPAEASYSLWRDELDYEIDWDWSGQRIHRFVDAVGFPYRGARTRVDGRTAFIHDVEEEPEVNIENRTAGKVIFVRDGSPVVVCGTGLIRINNMTDEDGVSLLPLKRFRTRFG